MSFKNEAKFLLFFKYMYVPLQLKQEFLISNYTL